jgi:rhodanese-related sulfurtransferase
VSVQTLSPRELKARMDAGEHLVLLDVREPDERNWCAIARSENIFDLHVPMAELPTRIDELPGDTSTIVVYCHHGVRSMMVAQWLMTQGVSPVLNLEGGIDAWSVEVDPSVRRYS